MLALGGLVVLEIEDRESRQAIFDILRCESFLLDGRCDRASIRRVRVFSPSTCGR